MSDRDLPLQGLRVLERSTGVAGAAAGGLLAALGAEVTLLEPPGGHPLAARGPFAAVRSLPDVYYHHGKQRMAHDGASDLASLASGFDGVILEGSPAEVDGWAAGLTTPCVAITPMGREGPRRDWRLDELTAQAYTGLTILTGEPERTPLRVGVPVAEYATGQAAAAALLMAMLRPATHPLGEVSLLDGMLSIMEHSYAIWEYQGRTMGRHGNHGRAAWGVYPCKDGYVGVISGLGEAWQRFRQLVGGPLLEPEFGDISARARHAGVIHALVLDWLSEKSMVEGFQLGQEANLPFSMLATAADLPAIDHLRERQFFESVAIDGQTASIPGAPARFRAAGKEAMAPPLAETPPTRGPLTGVRVLDFGIVWAGPHATRMLADQGAEVIKVESARRTDLIRGPARPLDPTAGCYPDADPGEQPWNRHGYFIERNRNKQDVCLDLTTPEGRELALRLAATCDVVLDNFRPGTMTRLGLSAEAIQALNPRTIVISMSAFGQTGPWRSYVGYGATIDALSGAVSTTGYLDEEMPQNLGINLSDPVAGQHAFLAVCAALVARERDGRGREIDASQLESAIRLMGVPLLEQQLLGRVGPIESQDPGEAFAAVLPCAGEEQWLAVACATPGEAAALCATLGAESTDGLAALTGGRERDALVEQLQAAGIAAAPVYVAEEALADPHLVARGFFVEVDHPKAGPRRYIGTPFRWQGRAQEFAYEPAPLLGEHTDEVLRRLLGVDEAELARLRTAGVTADDPRAFA